MKRLKTSALLAALTALAMLAVGAGLLHSQNAHDLYQKALSQEKAQGNLQQAITLYQKVIAGAGSDRALAARAQYHIGLCYEKLGTTEAEKAIRKVIDQYPEQKESVSAANGRLSLLAKPRSATQGTGISLRQVSVPYGKPSPDGRYFAHWYNHTRQLPEVKWNYDDIKLLDLATNMESLITNLISFESSSISDLAWSPSGEKIAFIVSQGTGTSRKSKLCEVGRTGSNFHVIYENPDHSISGIAGWLPDETAILVAIRNMDRSTTIGEVSLKSAQLKEIKNLGVIPSTYAVSPDGNLVVYSVRDSPKQKLDLRMISRKDGTDEYIVQHPADDTFIGWTPDSRYLLFRSDRSGAFAAWAQEITNGKPRGNPPFREASARDFIGPCFARWQMDRLQHYQYG